MMMKVNPQARQPPSMPNFRYTHLTAENGMSRIKVISPFKTFTSWFVAASLNPVTLLPSGHLATLCGWQSRIPLLCAIQVSLLIWKESWWYYLQSEIIIKPSKKSNNWIKRCPQFPLFLQMAGVSTITTTKAQANVFLSPKESLPERLQIMLMLIFVVIC